MNKIGLSQTFDILNFNFLLKFSTNGISTMSMETHILWSGEKKLIMNKTLLKNAIPTSG